MIAPYAGARPGVAAANVDNVKADENSAAGSAITPFYFSNNESRPVQRDVLRPLNVGLLSGNLGLAPGNAGLEQNGPQCQKTDQGTETRDDSLDALIWLPPIGLVLGFGLPHMVYKWPRERPKNEKGGH